jgi:hypothetical protein
VGAAAYAEARAAELSRISLHVASAKKRAAAEEVQATAS